MTLALGANDIWLKCSNRVEFAATVDTESTLRHRTADETFRKSIELALALSTMRPIKYRTGVENVTGDRCWDRGVDGAGWDRRVDGLQQVF